MQTNRFVVWCCTFLISLSERVDGASKAGRGEDWRAESLNSPFTDSRAGEFFFFYTFYGINGKTDNQLRQRCVFKCVSIVYKGNVFN